MHRLFVNSPLVEGAPADISPEDMHHIKNVLRLTEGEELMLCDPSGSTAAGIVHTKPEFVCIPGAVTKCHSGEQRRISLYMGLAKGDKFEFIIQKSVELGAAEIIPVAFAHCVAKIKEQDIEKKLKRWNGIAKSAAEQSGRDYIPLVKKPMAVRELKGELEGKYAILAYELEKENSLKKAIKAMPEDKELAVIVGPEGGIDDSEAAELVAMGAVSVTLGRRILRCETAPIALLSVLQYETGGLG